MKSARLALLSFLTGLTGTLFAQVWYPEGVYTQQAPALIAADNQLTTIARAGQDNTYSYWQVCVNDGKSWNKLPLLTLNRNAEVLDIQRYMGTVYVCGNFSFDNGSHNGLVRYNTERWEGLGQFKKPGAVPGLIYTLDVQLGQLIIGGLFLTVNGDTMPNLIRYNTIKYSPYFLNCKNCEPDNAVLDICSGDSTVAISGLFTRIMNRKTKYLLRLRDGQADTFMNTPRLPEKLAIGGEFIYTYGGPFKDKRIYKVGSAFTEINANLDSALHISEILYWEGKPYVCGLFSLNGEIGRPMILRPDANQQWTDISNNFKNPVHIAAGRGFLFAAGNSPVPLSIWNPNRFVVRFFPGAALVKASVFLDANNNCVREPEEKPLAKQFIKLPFMNRGVFSSEQGLAEFLVPNAVSTTHRFVVKPFRNIVRSNCADTAVSKTFNPGNYADSIQFPLSRIPGINDIRLSITSPKGKIVQKNGQVQYVLKYENVGSNAISGKVRLKKNPLFTKENTFPPFTLKQNDSVLQWDYNNLQPGESKTILYTAYPEDAYFDKAVQFEARADASITGGSTMYTEDDADSIPQQTGEAFSAFRKEVYPKPAAGDSITYLSPLDLDLRYHIAFNNFSTDTVFYAVVIDTLDLNLDMSFIEETGSNKSYYTEVQTDPANAYKGILIWHFPDIRLTPNPTKNYELQSSASYIGFKVVSKPLSAGYYIKNTASVYYDNRFAGNTNSVYCTLAISDLHDFAAEAGGLSVYPNPFAEQLHISGRIEAGEMLWLTDATGRTLCKSMCAEDGFCSLDTETLPAGIYVLSVSGQKGIRQIKLIHR